MCVNLQENYNGCDIIRAAKKKHVQILQMRANVRLWVLKSRTYHAPELSQQADELHLQKDPLVNNARESNPPLLDPYHPAIHSNNNATKKQSKTKQ